MTKSSQFSTGITKRLYKKYIGHNKIIAWYKGCPKYSTMSPPSLSQVFANKTVTFIMSGLQNRPLPHIADIAVTGKCNCNCIHCSFVSKRKNKKELSTEELKNLIDDTIDLGVTSINFVGGEPLMREDILELIRSVNPDLAITSIYTNGWLLKDMIKKLKHAGLTTVKVSIDSPKADIHDSLRKKEGLFDRAIEGLIAAKKEGMITAISCCITKKDIKDGSFNEMIELGKRLKVNEIIVFDAIPVGNFSHRSDLMEDKPILDEIMNITKKYNQRSDYPGIFVYSYVRSPKSMGCVGGVSYFYVDPYGEVFPCDFHNQSFGNIKQTPLYAIWDKMSNQRKCSSYCGCDMKKEKF